MYRFHLLEAAQRMALWYQLGNGTLVQGAGNQQDDVVDHVTVRNVVEECAERLHGMIAHMLEFNDEFLAQLVIDDRHGQRAGLVGQKLTVVGGLQMQLEIIQGLALLEVQVVGVSEYAALEAAAQTFQIASVDVEKTARVHHCRRPTHTHTVKRVTKTTDGSTPKNPH